MKFIYSTILLLIIPANAFIIPCLYQSVSSKFQGSIYECKTTTVMISEDKEVTKVVGIHTSGKTINDVKSLYIGGAYVHYLPSGFDKFLKNIERLYIQPSNSLATNGLKVFDVTDLKQFPKLKELLINYAQFLYLENDIFDNTPNIEYLHLYMTGTIHFGTNVLVPLKKLKSLYVNNNNCAYNSNYANTETDIEAFREYIAGTCKPTDWMIRNEKVRAAIKEKLPKCQ